MNKFPEMLTKRLRLRRFKAGDVDGLHACLGDADAMRYWNAPPCKTTAETARWVKILGKTTSPYQWLAWAVATRRGDRCIGLINYHHRDARNHKLEIGYVLAPGHQGRGLMAEGLRAVFDHCFAAMGVHRIEALIQPENKASIALVERLGFRLEGGPLRDYWRVGDGYRDTMIYALIAGEQTWKPRR